MRVLVRRRRTVSVTAEQAEERFAKLGLEDRVEDRIDGRVDVAEPEEEGVQGAWHAARPAPAVDDVDGEEAEPRAAQNRYYDGRPDCRSRLEVLCVAHSASPSHHAHAHAV